MRCTRMMGWKPVALAAVGMALFCGVSRAETAAHFEDLGLGPNSYWNGSDGSGEFTSTGSSFNNVFNPAWGSWAGWAYSSITDNTTPGWGNQYSAITGSGAGGSATYGIAYYDMWTPTIPAITLADGRDVPDGIYVTNSTYAYFAMRDGDDFVTAFGPNDWQKLTLTGKDGETVVDAVDFDLAVGTDIVNEWTWVDLSGLQNRSIDSLQFGFSGSQADMVPSYAAVDAVPEPSTVVMIVSAALCLGFWWRRRG